MKLFYTKERSNTSPIENNQNLIDYLDSVSLEWAVNIRNYLNDWIEKYPKNEVDELIKRMKIDFDSPFYELFLHELFLKLGFTLSTHPSIKNVKTKPDFLVCNSDSEFLLEARLVTEKTDFERKTESHEDYFTAQINKKVKSKNFFLNLIFVEFKSRQQTSLKTFLKSLQAFIDISNPDEITQKALANRSHTKFRYENEYVRTELSLIPKQKKFRHEYADHIIGLSGGKAKFVDTVSAIKTGLKNKSGKYGQILKPLIIGLNMTSALGFQENEVLEAIYGSSMYNIDKDSYSKRKNGFFGTETNPKHTRISGVLVSNIHYAGIHNSKITYYKNPYAKYAFSLNGLLNEVYYQNGETKLVKGKDLTEWISA